MIDVEKLSEILVDFFTSLEASALNSKRQIVENIGVDIDLSDSDDLAALVSALVFMSYKGKIRSAEKENGWIFSDLPEAKELLTQLKANGGKIRIGDFVYSLSKDNGKFIGRKIA